MLDKFLYATPFLLYVAPVGLALGFWCCWRWRTTISVLLTLFVFILGITSYNALMSKPGAAGNPTILLAIIGLLTVPLSVGWIVGAPLGWFVRWRRETSIADRY